MTAYYDFVSGEEVEIDQDELYADEFDEEYDKIDGDVVAVVYRPTVETLMRNNVLAGYEVVLYND